MELLYHCIFFKCFHLTYCVSLVCFVSTHCLTRHLQVKVQTSTLAKMQAFLQKKRDEDTAAQQEIKNLSDELERYNCAVIHSDYKLLQYFYLSLYLGENTVGVT